MRAASNSNQTSTRQSDRFARNGSRRFIAVVTCFVVASASTVRAQSQPSPGSSSSAAISFTRCDDWATFRPLSFEQSLASFEENVNRSGATDAGCQAALSWRVSEALYAPRDREKYETRARQINERMQQAIAAGNTELVRAYEALRLVLVNRELSLNYHRLATRNSETFLYGAAGGAALAAVIAGAALLVNYRILAEIDNQTQRVGISLGRVIARNVGVQSTVRTSVTGTALWGDEMNAAGNIARSSDHRGADTLAVQRETDLADTADLPSILSLVPAGDEVPLNSADMHLASELKAFAWHGGAGLGASAVTQIAGLAGERLSLNWLQSRLSREGVLHVLKRIGFRTLDMATRATTRTLKSTFVGWVVVPYVGSEVGQWARDGYRHVDDQSFRNEINRHLERLQQDGSNDWITYTIVTRLNADLINWVAYWDLPFHDDIKPLIELHGRHTVCARLQSRLPNEAELPHWPRRPLLRDIFRDDIVTRNEARLRREIRHVVDRWKTPIERTRARIAEVHGIIASLNKPFLQELLVQQQALIKKLDASIGINPLVETEIEYTRAHYDRLASSTENWNDVQFLNRTLIRFGCDGIRF